MDEMQEKSPSSNESSSSAKPDGHHVNVEETLSPAMTAESESEESQNQSNDAQESKCDQDDNRNQTGSSTTRSTANSTTRDGSASEPAAVATPSRSGRAHRLVRKQEQINHAGRSRSPMRPIGTPTRVSAHMTASTSERSPARAVLPGDDLVPSPTITSRPRPVAAAAPRSNPEAETLTRGPLPPGPRLKSGTPNNHNVNNNTSSDNHTQVSSSASQEQQTPGAYQERARAIGDIPVWARNEIQTTAEAGPRRPANNRNDNTNESQPDCQPENNGEEMTATFTLASNIDDVENSGLTCAEPVAEGETVVYAEDIKEDEVVQERRKLVIVALVSTTIIVVLIVVLLAVLLRGRFETQCDLPINKQTISIYCQCRNTADGYLEHFRASDESVIERYNIIKSQLGGKDWMRPGADLSPSSCDVENMILKSMAILGKGIGMDYINKSQHYLGEVYSTQVFAILSLYFSLNGDSWFRKQKW